MMISVCVKKAAAEPKAVSVGEPASIGHFYALPANYQHTFNNGFKGRPLSSVSDGGLSTLRLRGEKMTTKGHFQMTKQRERSKTARWFSERSYTLDDSGFTSSSDGNNGHLRPTFPDVGIEHSHRVPRPRVVKSVRRNTWTGEMLRRQAKQEKEYKAMRTFTRSGRNDVKNNNHQMVEHLPPSGYTSFVTGKPLLEQQRMPSAKERAHKRFLEKLELQNRWLNDLSDSDDDTGDLTKSVLKIPSCSDVGEDMSSPGRASLHMAMDGLRIANQIEQSLATQQSRQNGPVGIAGRSCSQETKSKKSRLSEGYGAIHLNNDTDRIKAQETLDETDTDVKGRTESAPHPFKWRQHSRPARKPSGREFRDRSTKKQDEWKITPGKGENL